MMKTREDILRQKAQKEKGDLNKQLDEHSKKFNTTVVELLGLLIEKDKKNGDIKDLKDKVIAAKGSTPTLLIEEGGPVLLHYRQPIKDGKLEHLIHEDYTIRAKEMACKHGSESKVQDILSMIDYIKGMYPKLNEAEKTVVAKKLKGALKSYASYAQLCKQMNEKK